MKITKALGMQNCMLSMTIDIALNIFSHIVEDYCDRRQFLPIAPVFSKLHLSSNRNLNLDTSLNVDNDLLDNLGGGVETTPY
jgi:hypothetical protein